MVARSGRVRPRAAQIGGILAAIALTAPVVKGVSAQEGPVDGAVPTAWYTTAGLSGLIVDFGELHSGSVGYTMGGGVTWADVEVGGQAGLWPRGDWRMVSLQLQSSLPFPVTNHFAVDLVSAFGYSRADYLGDPRSNVIIVETAGAGATFGARLRFQSGSSWGARAGAFMRTDAGGWNGEWRLLVSASPHSVPTASRNPGPVKIGFRVYHMIPIAGPWRFATPGYAAFIDRPTSGPFSAVLAVALFYWEIPSEEPAGGYIWNTGAFAAFPSAQWRRGGFSTRLGPSIVAMGEGPDNGVTLGLDAEAEYSIDIAGVAVSVGGGWMWLVRGADGTTHGDQHGLMLLASVGF